MASFVSSSVQIPSILGSSTLEASELVHTINCIPQGVNMTLTMPVPSTFFGTTSAIRVNDFFTFILINNDASFTVTLASTQSTTGDLVIGASSTGEFRLVWTNVLPPQTYTVYRTGGTDSSLSTAVTGPGSATDEAFARFDGTTGALLQNSVLTMNDAGTTLSANGDTLFNLTTIATNLGVGTDTLLATTTGHSNTSVGQLSLDEVTLGFRNTAVGYAAMSVVASGLRNTAIGSQAMFSAGDGSNNTVVGAAQTPNFATLGNGNLMLGTFAGTSSTTDVDDAICLMNTGSGNVDGEIRIGTSGTHGGNIVLAGAAVASSINVPGGAGVDFTISSTSGGLNLSGGEGTTITGAIFTGGAITGTTTLTEVDSGTTYAVAQDNVGPYVIALPTSAAGLNFKFVVIAQDANPVTIRATGAHLYGNYDNVGTPVAVNAQTDIIFDATDARVGDTIEVTGISTTQWLVKGVTTNASGMSTA